MSAIKKMNNELRGILGRDPTIHEQVDILILAVVKERAYELQVAYEMNPLDEYKESYQQTLRAIQEIQDRNPDIFSYRDSGGRNDKI